MNVPFGGYKNPDYVSSENLGAVSEYLNRRDENGDYRVSLLAQDFRKALAVATPNDWVYLDPPYVPVSATSSFVSYSADGFSVQDQIELKETVDALSARGVKVLLSNSDTPFTRELFGDTDIYEIDFVQVRRTIAATTASRGAVGELLVNNYRAVGGKNG